MAGIEEQAKSLNIKAVIVSLIVSSFGFVAALFWRDAIKELIAKLVPEGQGIAYSFGAAIAVTIIAVIAIYFVANHLTRLDLQDVRELKKLKRIKEIKKLKRIKNLKRKKAQPVTA